MFRGLLGKHWDNVFSILASTIWSSLEGMTVTSLQVTITWEVTVTSNDSTICSSLQVTSLLKIFENFFLLYFCILGNFTSFAIKKFFWKFSELTVTWSDVTSQWHYHLLVTSQVTVTSEKWPSLLRSNDQMVEALVITVEVTGFISKSLYIICTHELWSFRYRYLI